MKLAYVTTYDASDIHAWSGLGYNILKALRETGLEIETVGALHDHFSLFVEAKRIFTNKVLKKQYLRDREPMVLRSYARQVERHIALLNPDIIFSPGTIPIAYLRTNKPIVFWTDATFAGMIGFYSEFSNLCRETIRQGNYMEQAALAKCRLAIYSSDWAAKTAIENYHVDSHKVRIVPFGSNLDSCLSQDQINSVMTSRASHPCKLLFVGIDWLRKGGEAALAVAELLNERGLDTELHVVGCIPPATLPKFVKLYGYLSKKDQNAQDLLRHLYKTSHFFILPTRAECSPIVFAEANSYALPALTTNVGGIPTGISDGRNGRMFSITTFVPECAEYILKTFSVKKCYENLCFNALDEYTNRLNWQSAGRSVTNLLNEFCR